jgi:hypothetical protein
MQTKGNKNKKDKKAMFPADQTRGKDVILSNSSEKEKLKKRTKTKRN